MTQELILVRHGKAEPHGTRADYDRALTEEGIAEIRQMAPALAKKVEGKETVLITSPLVRARETAEILADALGCPMEIDDWVAEGIFSEVLATKERPEEVVILVGHNPTFDEWHEQLTYERDHFKKGAAASYRWQEGEPQAKLNWLHTAKELARGEENET